MQAGYDALPLARSEACDSTMTSTILSPLPPQPAAAVLGFRVHAGGEYATGGDTAFIFYTILFLIGGFLVFWMQRVFADCSKRVWCDQNVTTQ